MRRFGIAMCVCVMSVVASDGVVLAQGRESTFTGTLRAGDAHRLELGGDIEGDLNGAVTVVLNLSGDDIGGGTWTVDIRQQDGSGTWYETGTLRGTVNRGSLRRGPDGRVVGADAIELEITHGEGELGNVVSGAGSLSLSLSGDASRATGMLSLTF